jgi:hypothetical protein
MTWGFLWLMLALKIPIGGLLYIVWWAVHQTDEPATAPQSDDGGTKRPRHPHGPLPRTPRRGPHNTPAPAAPPRVRSAVVARSRELPPV